jgi:outer membrane immunogenic protein
VKKSGYILTAIFAACVSTHAVAQPAYNWTGFYIGAHGGFLRADQEITIDTSPTVFGKPDSGFAGLQIGYWAPLSHNWLYGFEADVSFASSDTDVTTGARTQFDRFGTARTRVGYANGPWLLFASGGLAWSRMSMNDIPTTFVPINTKHSFLGWSAGLGVEYALSQRWSARAEYLYVDLGRNAENIFGFTVGPDVSFSAVRLGLNYRLGSLPNSTPRMAQRRGAFNWSGAYIGAHGAYASGEQTMVYTFTVPFSPKGAVGGVQSGYNWQLASNVVLGIESDISFGKIDGDFLAGCCTVKIDRLGTVRLRAGYAFDNVLIYGTGGLAWAKTDNQYFFSFLTSDRPFLGWTAGVGVEYALSPLWSVKGEYLRIKFDATRTEYVGVTAFDETGEYDMFRIGLNYRASLFDILARR